MEEKNLTYKTPALTDITLQSIMKEEMKKQVDDYLRKTIFKYTALVLQDFMPDARTSWNSFVDMTKEAYKEKGFQVLKELLSYINYSNIQTFSLKAGVDGAESADPIIRVFSSCVIDNLSFVPNDADKVSLANSAFQYIKGTLIPIAISSRFWKFRGFIDMLNINGGEFIDLSQCGMFECDKNGVFKAIRYNDEAPKYKHTSVGCLFGYSDLDTNEEMNILRAIEDDILLSSAFNLIRNESQPTISNERIFEEFKKVALRMNMDGQIEDMTYEILTDKEKNAVGDVCVRLSSLYRSNELLAHKKSFVSFFPEDDELVMSKGVSSEVSVSSNIDIFSETFMKSYDENVGETLLIAEGKMKIIHGLMEAICNMMSNVFSIDTRRRLRIVYDGDDTRLEGYITPYMSWGIYLKTSALITSQLNGHVASTGNPERKDEPFSVLLMSDIMVSPKNL